MAEIVNSERFNNILQSEETVLADFYSETCVPCRRMSPILSEVENEFGGKLKAIKVNVAFDGDLAQEYDVRAVPTFIMFKNGKEASRILGAVPKTELASMVKDSVK